MAHPTTFLPLGAGFPDLMGHHRHLLDDRVRTTAFLHAIARTVRPGDVVADLGAGTGVLSFAARRAGARVVYAIERGPILAVAQAVARANRQDRIVFVHGDAHTVELPEPVDVIVSECFGPLAIGGTMIAALAALRRRHLKPTGRVVPGRVTIHLAPVESPRDHRFVSGWTRPRYAIDWAAAQPLATNNLYNTTFRPSALLARPASLVALDLSRDDFVGELAATAQFTPTRAAWVHGFAGWFVAELAEGVTLSTAPGHAPTIWRQVFFPLTKPLRVSRRSVIEVAIATRPAHLPGQLLFFDWSGRIDDTPFAQSTRYSFPDAPIV